MSDPYKSGSLSLPGAIAMGTGVMIGAGIFALTGQVAEMAGPLFPLAFLVAAIVSGFSAYSYVKMANAYPSAGGIGMFLNKAYGRSVMTGACALLMVFSMIINESLVARTFGTYTMQAFGGSKDSIWVPILGVLLIAAAFAVNVATNKLISRISMVAAAVKVGGILIFAAATLYMAGFSFEPASSIGSSDEPAVGMLGFVAAVALGILAYKGFTTITNSGSELSNPEKNVGRAIIISLTICLVVYLLVGWAVGSTLSIPEIVQTRDYALAEASRPAFGEYGVWFTVGVAIVATASGILASIFAVSRMMAMLTKMEMIPHRHLGMSGHIQTHMLVYICVIAALLTVFFDLSRIASLGAIFYLIMDIAVHWGVFRYLRRDINAKGWVMISAMVLDLVVLCAFIWLKWERDIYVLYWAAGGVVAIFVLERLFLRFHGNSEGEDRNYVSPADWEENK
ncbi:APC family permease [Allohahella marinimesophila]|uniref:APC family permease n=1 Tax=Allohahella marinimesophila TaxID=1054972 RepID=A0ABP7NJV8_9GAMM